VFAGLVGLASLATVSRPGVGLLALGVVMGVGLLMAWAFAVPRRIVPRVPDALLDGLPSDRDRLEVTEANAKLRNEVRTTVLQALGGLAVLAGAVLAFQQLTEDRQQANATRELTLQGQASERFTRAIDQLGSDRREVQLGGIYGLERIAQQAPDNRLAVTEVLVAYLRRRVPTPAKPPPDDSPVKGLRVRASDAQAVLTVLGRRQVAQDDPPLDLAALDLRRADLRRADLRFAELLLADFRRADLSGAALTEADLGGADLGGADVAGADLSGAILVGVDLGNADLTGADLSGARIRGVLFAGGTKYVADLRGANLGGTNLRGMDLRETHLEGAIADQHTTWPDGFDWRRAGVRTITIP